MEFNIQNDQSCLEKERSVECNGEQQLKKTKFLIENEEWELVRMFAAELLDSVRQLRYFLRYFLSQNQLHRQIYLDFMDF